MRNVNALLLNDIHIGVVRTAGTTLATRAAIQQYLLDSMHEIIWRYVGRDLIINGDLFDGYEIDSGQLLAVYLMLHDWLTKNPDRVLHLVRGNHDIAKNSLRTSSFALLCSLLTTSFGDRVKVYNDRFAQIGFAVWVIPHCVNQDLFNLELEKAEIAVTDEGVVPGYLLLHANFDNNFAVEADHSLNVSEEWARRLNKVGWTLVFAHEHQRRTAMAGQVVITGNQWPTSVSDCLAHGEAQKDGKKFAHLFETTEDFINDKLTVSLKPTPEPTWDASTDFAAMEWTDLDPTTECRFVRVEGTATAADAADVINTIARFRQKSDAWVITNSVNVAGIAGVSEMAKVNTESLAKVDILASLLKKLEPKEADKVCELLGIENTRKDPQPC
jgi:metallophosphoesterase superfamily enzyme